MISHRVVCWVGTALVVAGTASGAAQSPAPALTQAVDQLGDFDYGLRVIASRAVRGAEPDLVAPLLRDAVRQHADSYVQFRALVLLYGIAPEHACDTFEVALASSNDRVRSAAYDFFEHAPDPAIAPKLLAALAMRDHPAALDTLFEVGVTSESPARAPIALALGAVALRQPDVVRTALERRPMPDTELLLLRDAFNMLDEDMAEERFYLRMRRSYWNAADGSSARRFAETALRVLEF